jgi:hypothetical protein
VTTFASPRPHEHVTNEANESDVAPIRDILQAADSDGLPLNALFERLGAEGYPLPGLSTAVMQLLREERVELTPERRVRWVEPAQ